VARVVARRHALRGCDPSAIRQNANLQSKDAKTLHRDLKSRSKLGLPTSACRRRDILSSVIVIVDTCRRSFEREIAANRREDESSLPPQGSPRLEARASFSLARDDIDRQDILNAWNSNYNPALAHTCADTSYRLTKKAEAIMPLRLPR